MSIDWYDTAVRPLLFRLDAERAHELIGWGLRSSLPAKAVGRWSRLEDPRLETDLAGIPLANPIGLAPGLDKNGLLVPGLDELGFGYITIGSVTTEPRSGNPRPRMARRPDTRSLVNSLGLPSLGLEAVVEILSSVGQTKAPILASVAGFGSDELLRAAEAIGPHVAAVEIGLICPNTSESERMDEIAIFTDLADGLAASAGKPVLVKLPPHHDDAERNQVMRMLDVCVDKMIDGVSVSGGRTVRESRLAAGRGSLNGRETHADALRITSDVARHVGGRLAIKASGGVFDGRDAAALLRAGATTVELYTSLVYNGWRTVGSIKRGLLDEMEIEGVEDLPGLAETSDGQATG